MLVGLMVYEIASLVLALTSASDGCHSEIPAMPSLSAMAYQNSGSITGPDIGSISPVADYL
jgi:hypothetical protein